ncbi:hypothetical protein L1987_64854 [Smallanthus sonchifolius]|uniref:Uncharacterized protein n=1 Tax=Smallanthus sonchifolius TaxID=185202 RepID=A0ACB9BT38_9ASTR|nr:hypothetical protein L1987_64854 [Smallanthus sonchifolius]
MEPGFKRVSGQVRGTYSVKVYLEALELNIPGIYVIHDFVSAQEEEVRDLGLLYISIFFHWFTNIQLITVTIGARPWHKLLHLIQALGIVLQREGFNIMAMNFAMMSSWIMKEKAVEEIEVDPDVAAMMGFGGFGSSKK